jgi:hypothetical protein
MFSGRQPNSDCGGLVRSFNSAKLAIHPTQYEIPANPPFILFHAAFFWRCLSMMRRHYIRSYGAFGAQSRYRIRPTVTSRIGSDVREAGRWGLSLEIHQQLS